MPAPQIIPDEIKATLSIDLDGREFLLIKGKKVFTGSKMSFNPAEPRS